MRTLEVELVRVEMGLRRGLGTLWLTFRQTRRAHSKTITAPARQILQFALPDYGREPRWLYFLCGGRLLIVEADQFRAKMSKASEALESAREVVPGSEVTTSASPTATQTRGSVAV